VSACWRGVMRKGGAGSPHLRVHVKEEAVFEVPCHCVQCSVRLPYGARFGAGRRNPRTYVRGYEKGGAGSPHLRAGL